MKQIVIVGMIITLLGVLGLDDQRDKNLVILGDLKNPGERTDFAQRAADC